MQGRSLSTAALAVASAAVLVALVALVLQVRAAPPEPQVEPGELSRAASSAHVRPAGAPPAESAPPPTPDRPPAPPEPPPAPPTAPRDERAAASDPQAATEIATEYYDRGEYESARTAAVDALRLGLEPPAADKMLRIAASASCFMGEPEQARVHYDQLAPRSQRDIARRCRRMGIEF